ncbi:carbohydrate-binding module family 20 domain-containing protein [Candidatus Finniella inopinata]|uniref:CBM20 domain-containing protein n=1 Tax=Candidatus Finniella inopinata TaxID=1696036 RepID=A0A4Q7DEQ0_9PROT|nr:carbohydrate-binding module family 20 domain-containing protein [Candidatus Finniella inopinata]RZI45201.1 hypothetical protein EQU50_07925 [Candidatus Finniella inopinata]
MTRPSADVAFSCSSQTLLGENVFVGGNHPLLGNWAPRPDAFNALLNMSNDGTSSYPTWNSLTMRFPVNLTLEYKFGKTWQDSQKINVWEPGDNQQLTVTASS